MYCTWSNSNNMEWSKGRVHVRLLYVSLLVLCFPAFLFQSVLSFRVVVVGGGVGGLATAARIAASSSSSSKAQVHLLEKNTEVGGRCGSFSVELPQGSFRHERGPSLLLLPHVYEKIFSDLGTTAKDYGLDMIQCKPAYKVIFEDGDMIDLGFPQNCNETMTKMMQDMASASRKKMDSYETNGANKWDEYMQCCEAFLDCGLPNFIEQKFDVSGFPAFLRESLRGFGKAWPLKPHSDVLDAIFDSDKMIALASFQDLYVGLEPYRNPNKVFGGVLQSTAPAVFGLLAAIELHPTNAQCGVFAPRGGFRSVARSLERLAVDVGVNVHCNTTVTSVTEEGVFYNKPESSEEATPSFMAADLVIVNADLPYATQALIDQPINQPAVYDWDDKYSFSSGVVAFHWSLSKALIDLNTHNVFLSAAKRSLAEESWDAVRNTKEASEHAFNSTDEPFNFYVHRAGATDATAAPEGMDAILVLVPCRTLQRQSELGSLPREHAIATYKEQFDSSYVERIRRAVLHRLAAVASMQDVSSLILDEVVDTPATYASQYNVGAGTPFALSHGFAQLSLARPGPAFSSLQNVLFSGASTRPGNGVPLVLIGAEQVAKIALHKSLKY